MSFPRLRIQNTLFSAGAIALAVIGFASGPASAADQMVSGAVRTGAVGVAVPGADTVSGNGRSTARVQVSSARRPDGVLVVTVVPR